MVYDKYSYQIRDLEQARSHGHNRTKDIVDRTGLSPLHPTW